MCRNIRPLHNFEPPADEREIRAAALQYVRKVSGVQRPSEANRVAFESAVDQITEISRRLLLEQLDTKAAPKDRDVEKERARDRGREREARLLATLREAK